MADVGDRRPAERGGGAAGTRRLRGASVVAMAAVALAACGGASVASAPFGGRDDVRAFVTTMAARHGFDRRELEAVFARAERKQSVLDAISRPAERRLAWHEYRRIFVQPERIDEGVRFWRRNADALQRARDTFAVPPSVIVAIIGVETRYGQTQGNYRVIDALSTLAFDYPPRSAFFTRELEEFLLLAREEARPLESMTGSYAGAMGYGQFIPSSYRAYAVDFDGDDARDIWSNEQDAIGSVANYLHAHGWQPDTLAMVRAHLARPEARSLANARLALDWTIDELAAAGVEFSADLSPDTPACLVALQAENETEYWLGLNNFFVVTRYNRSRLYAKAVLDLASDIATAFNHPTP